jgi:hypothetical protein
MVHISNPRFWAIALAVSLAGGCGSGSNTVTGEVTYEGQPVGGGFVTFLPADGKGPSVGGALENGRYTVENITPGPKVMKVEAVKAVKFARSSQEMADMAAARKAKGDDSGMIERADVIPPDAEGNNAPVEIKAGAQTINIHLKKPAGTKGR